MANQSIRMEYIIELKGEDGAILNYIACPLGRLKRDQEFTAVTPFYDDMAIQVPGQDIIAVRVAVSFQDLKDNLSDTQWAALCEHYELTIPFINYCGWDYPLYITDKEAEYFGFRCYH